MERPELKHYLETTDSVLRAGRRLQKYMDGDKSELELAVTQLEQAAESHTAGASRYRAFLLERPAEDTLPSILTDIETANVLMSAGQALGETDKRGDADMLDRALLNLETSQASMQRAAVGGVGFAADVATEAAPPPADVPAAAQKVKDLAGETLQSLVDEAQGVVEYIADALGKLDKAKVLEVFGNMTDHVKEIQGIGRLFSQGVAKLKSALGDLAKFLGPKGIETIKTKVEELWNKIQKDELIRDGLEWAYDIKSTRELVSQVTASAGLKLELLVEAVGPVIHAEDSHSRDNGDIASTFRRSHARHGSAGILALGCAECHGSGRWIRPRPHRHHPSGNGLCGFGPRA
jgi:hypothetical protein